MSHNSETLVSNSSRSTLVSSVAKAVGILDCFTPSHGELSLTQLSALTGMPKSTLLNQLRTLEEAGLLLHDSEGQVYSLGYKLMELGYKTYSSIPVIRSAVPVMENLMNETGNFIYLTSHLNGRVFYMDCMYPSHRDVSYSVSGKTLPMHCTSCGKAMLSRMETEAVQKIIDRWGLTRITINTITDPELLWKELELTRQRGYALDDEEESPGVRCYAMPILNSEGIVAGALSISGAAFSMKNEPTPEHLDALASACSLLAKHADLFPAIRSGNLT